MPLLAQPNAGQPINQDYPIEYEDTPEIMMQHVPALVEAGANIIGGCCGATAEWIQTLREWVDQHS